MHRRHPAQRSEIRHAATLYGLYFSCLSGLWFSMPGCAVGEGEALRPLEDLRPHADPEDASDSGNASSLDDSSSEAASMSMDDGVLETTGTGHVDDTGQASDMQTTGDSEGDWGPCPQGWASAATQCRYFDVPLNWSRTSGEQIEVFVTRDPARTISRGQLWVLDGGPGSPGRHLGTRVRETLPGADDFDILVLSHRGTGLSTALCCTNVDLGDPAGWPIESCASELWQQWGPGLHDFDSHQAALDLDHVIESTRSPTDEVVIYGLSYGSYWAQRYLQIAPEGVDAVILDGILDLQAEVWQNAILADESGHRLYAELCAEHPDCAEHFPVLPLAAAQSVHDGFNQALPDICPPFADVSGAELADMQRALVSQAGTWPGSGPLSTALTLRLYRCNASDQSQLAHFLQAWRHRPEADPVRARDDDCESKFSVPLYLNVLAHELLAPLPQWPSEQLDAHRDQLLFHGDHVPLQFEQVFASWPRPEGGVGPEHHRQAESAVPMLILQGGQDYQTVRPWARRLADHFDAAQQHFVELDVGGHVMALGNTATAAAFDCIQQVVGAFLADPRAQPGQRCQSQVYALDFAGLDPATQAASQRMFGTTDLYNEAGRKVPAPSRSSPPRWPWPRDRGFPTWP